MRITYQDGMALLSLTNEEVNRLVKDHPKPTEIEITNLPHLLLDISNVHYNMWKDDQYIDFYARKRKMRGKNE